MLVLTRKPEESIIVVSPRGEIIEISLAKLDNERARIGIEAPMTFRIFRKEVYDTMVQENLACQCESEHLDKLRLLKTFTQNIESSKSLQ